MPVTTLYDALARLGVGGILAAVLLFLHLRQMRLFGQALLTFRKSRARDRKECHAEIMALGESLRAVQEQVFKLAEAVLHVAQREEADHDKAGR